MAIYKIGDLITFTYPAVHLQGTKAHDRFPQVLVLHPYWDRHPPNNSPGNYLVHGLAFKYLSNDEINLIRMFISKDFKLEYYINLLKKNPALVNQFNHILDAAERTAITNPHDFYLKVIRPFIQPRGWDPYRLYRPDKMTGVRILQNQAKMMGPEINYLFNKGKESNQDGILANLAKKQAQEEQFHQKILTPEEQSFLRRLQGKARDLFLRYKQKFEYSRGSRVRWNMPSFRRNKPPTF